MYHLAEKHMHDKQERKGSALEDAVEKEHHHTSTKHYHRHYDHKQAVIYLFLALLVLGSLLFLNVDTITSNTVYDPSKTATFYEENQTVNETASSESTPIIAAG